MSLRSTLIVSLPLVTGLLAGCLDHPVKKVTYDKTQVDDITVDVQLNKDVDILFVIDNSGSMADEQATLSKNFEAFIGVLERKDVDANYRIGITTTDAGNPLCKQAQTTPEGGKLVLSSCLDRMALGDFTFNMDDYGYACSDYCKLDDAALTDRMKPTETQYSDGEVAPRRWIERIEGKTNLPDDVSSVEAFQCFGPQGVSGCGMESHLESMYLALAQASRADSPTNYGFLRDQAILSVVFITDELDCSYNPEFGEIFTTDKTFWSNPDDPQATSAVCFNAGVKCDGDGPTYTNCRSANFGVDGTEGVSDDQAVLRPLSKYVNFLQTIEDAKKVTQPDQEVLVALIAGVPPGYETKDADVIYEDSSDPEFQDSFGIGAGCTLANAMDPDKPQTAVPPVREREFAEAFQVGEDRNLFSICQDDYSEALRAIAKTLEAQLKPACMTECVKDIDPTTPVVDPSCVLTAINAREGTREDIPSCEEVGGEWVAPAGSTACFAELIDADDETPSAIDNMDAACVAEGFNLEFKLIRTAPAPAGTTFEATCELSPNPSQDCPML
ncbi:vWA domain-containing protein [Nannocystis bainbridge]|uniref:VWA domain-containing protein n=1 Tax=Nannocystis bainbridge TaxID=2995303 RepID=A0ABT5E529_9BACT|nr:vWA domain-containing protein [Nannocystis bainbridge]MDC0719882.1 VWA domain-containing protein [Nannocystis bainbridge]